MKRYWLFSCYDYEASGGLDDLKAIGDSVDDLKKIAEVEHNAWIVDTETWITILRGELDQRTRNKYDWETVNEPVKPLLPENKQQAENKITEESRIRKAINEIRDYYDEKKKNSKEIICGSPYFLEIEGGISSGGRGNGRLACGIDNNNLKTTFGVLEPGTNDLLTEEIDLDGIKSFSVTVSSGDIVQAEFETIDGTWIRCPVSELKVSLNGMRASEFNIGKYKREESCDDTTEGNEGE